MLVINPKNIEKFFDILDESSMLIHQHTKKDYLECLIITSRNILSMDEVEDLDVDENVLEELESLYSKIEDEKFNKEEVRKAFQLAMLKGFKHIDVNISEITPDSIGMLFTYFINLFFKGKEISIFDASVGTGNLLMTILNNSDVNFNEIYGADINYSYMNIALTLSDLLEYNIEFFNQNSLKPLFVPLVDLVISDLPLGYENDVYNELITSKNNISYKPYLFVENLIKYSKPGGYFIYLIPNDFFTNENNGIIKEVIFRETYIKAIVQLPESLFTNKDYQKSILILQKKGENILPTKEILMLMFPNFNEKEKVNKAIDKIEQWFNNNNR